MPAKVVREQIHKGYKNGFILGLQKSSESWNMGPSVPAEAIQEQSYKQKQLDFS